MIFVLLFLFRYTRLLVSLIAVWCYKPKAPQNHPVFSTKDVTVILPTVDPAGINFEECIHSIQETDPFEIIIVTAGGGRGGKTNFEILEHKWKGYPAIRLMNCKVMNKRTQLYTAISVIRTPITIFCDDHVFWPLTFMPHILAPFSDASVGIVGTAKRVRRTIHSFSLAAFCNVLGCLYLEQHNFDLRATSAIDRGCFVISSRTVALRTDIVNTPAFLQKFTNEMIFFGLVGPLNADDDNFVTRWLVNHGWKTAWQDVDGGRIETTIGDDEGGMLKFLAQNLRWMRTRWRSNATALFRDRTVWMAQPWCVYAVYINSFVNFALFYDTALLYSLWTATEGTQLGDRWTWMSALLLWILCSKTVKTAAYWRRHPRDLIYLPGCILFGYFHSLIKLYALFTFWNVGWGSRKLCDGSVSTGHTKNTTWEDTASMALLENQCDMGAKGDAKSDFTDSGYASAEEGE